MAYLHITIPVLIALALFFYYGYRDDFKRNPKEFVVTLFSVIGGIIFWVIIVLFVSAFTDLTVFILVLVTILREIQVRYIHKNKAE